MTYIEGSISALIQERTGYGTLGHLVEILLNDREIHGGDAATAVHVVERACKRADSLWDNIIGPMLDQLEGELLR
jgi:hypothetical protein